MDRATKLMFGMLTAAFCLMVIMMISREAPQAHAQMYQGDRGEELTIVSFRVTPIGGTSENVHNLPFDTTGYLLLTRMWSDGSVEINLVGSETIPNSNQVVGSGWRTSELMEQSFTGWKLVTDSVAGFRCAGDTDGNRDVDIEDLLSVINDYGACEQDPPLNLPPDSDQ